jgi:hypothetical protein
MAIPPGKLTALALSVGLVLIFGLSQPGAAAFEDAALFYEELAPHGDWVDYGDYGPVWYPTRVTPNWRPYLDGRWVPTDQGWIFETLEPWGWATYHYGNWMPTEDYGWVWVPGRTWYPSTAAWRTSDDYIGWAPIPPPNYVPSPTYYPPGGYFPGTPVLDLITAPFWIFAQAAGFLLGFGQPYLPTYSYYNCGCLTPFPYVPSIYPRTRFLTDFYYPAYAPRAFYVFGPSFPFVSRVTRIEIVRINTFARTVTFDRIRHAKPPRTVLDRRPYIREIVPEPVRERQRFEARRATGPDLSQARRLAARPDVAPRPREAPRIREEIPRAAVRPPVREAPRRVRPEVREAPRPERLTPARPRPERLAPEPRDRFRGTRLPPQAVREPRDMRRQMEQQRRLERRLPRDQQRRFQQEERQLRRQDVFRERGVQRPAAPRARPEIRRQAPQPRPQIRRQAPQPRPQIRREAPRARPERGRTAPRGTPERGRGR